MDAVAGAIAALRAGRVVLLPTDTVYGLAAAAARAEHTERLYRLKGRDAGQPTALLAASVAQLETALPELRPGDRAAVEALLPGPYTLVVANPGRRFAWLAGSRPEAVGVRVPELPPAAAAAVEAVGPVVATSANEPGGPDPRSVGDVPERLLEGCAAVLDAGALPGVASTVVDLTGAEPRILREGAVPASEALARIASAGWRSQS